MTIPTQGQKHMLATVGPFADTPHSTGLSHLTSGRVCAAGGDPGFGSTLELSLYQLRNLMMQSHKDSSWS